MSEDWGHEPIPAEVLEREFAPHEVGEVELAEVWRLPTRAIPKATMTGWFSTGATTWDEVRARYLRRVAHEVKSLPWTLIRFLIWIPHFMNAVFRHLWVGRAVVVALWWTWVSCNDYMAPLLQQNMDKGRAPSAEEIEEGRKPTATPTQRAGELYRHRRSRWLLTLAGAFVLGNAPWALDLFAPGSSPLGIPWNPSLYWAYLWAGLVLLEQIGRRYEPPAEEAIEERKIILHPNIPIGMLRSGIEAFFGAYGFKFKLTTTDVSSHWFRFGYYSAQEVTSGMLRQLERSLGAGPKTIRADVDSGDASTGILTLMVSDPLGDFVPSPHARVPGQRDILEKLDLGPCEDGTTTGVTFAHCPVVIVAGQTGSGKSGIVNNVVERLTDTWNGYEVYCVDPTDGPDSNVLAGFYTAFKGQKVTTTELAAEELIDYALADCTRRNRVVNDVIQNVRPDPETGIVPKDVPRNHAPTRDEPQRWIVIEEYPQTRGWKTFTEKVERLVRICRKGAWGVIVVTQSTTKQNGLGSTIIQNQATIRLIGSTKPGELPYAIGQGAAEQGFHPETLIPATKTKVNDAGKFYALSPDRWEPMLTRAWGLEFSEIIQRIFERTGEEVDLAEWEEEVATDRDGDGIPDEYDDDPDDANVVRPARWLYEEEETEVSDGTEESTGDEGSTKSSPSGGPSDTSTPPLLLLLLKVAKDSNYTRIPTRWIMAELKSTPGPWQTWDVNKLGNALRQLGMPRSTQLGKGPWGNSSKGYRQADVEAVIRGEKFD